MELLTYGNDRAKEFTDKLLLYYALLTYVVGYLILNNLQIFVFF